MISEIWSDFQFNLWRAVIFLRRDSKNKTYGIADKFLISLLFTFAPQNIHKLQRTNRFIIKAGRKDKGQYLSAKSFLKEKN